MKSDNLSDLMSRWASERDDLGRPIVHIDSAEMLRDYIEHPNKLPPGDLHFYSRIPLGPAHKELFEVLVKTRTEGARIGFSGPPPELIQYELKQRLQKFLDDELREAGRLDADELTAMRHRVAFADSEGLLVIPFIAAEDELAKALIENMDIHSFAPCPAEQWLREDMDAFMPVVAKYLQLPASEIASDFVLNCKGGMEGMSPSLCESSGSEPPHNITVGHGFNYVSLVAAKACAASIRLGPTEEKSITAKEINDSLRMAILWYLGEIGRPAHDQISQKMLPHQLLITDRVVHGMRRFAIAHELGHILLWRTAGFFSDFRIPFETLSELASANDIPAAFEEVWISEIACDILAMKLLQESVASITESLSQDPPSNAFLPSYWDFVGTDLLLTLWHFLGVLPRGAEKSDASTRPRGEVRRFFLRSAFPPWIQDLGISLSAALSARLTHL